MTPNDPLESWVEGDRGLLRVDVGLSIASRAQRLLRGFGQDRGEFCALEGHAEGSGSVKEQ